MVFTPFIASKFAFCCFERENRVLFDARLNSRKAILLYSVCTVLLFMGVMRVGVMSTNSSLLVLVLSLRFHIVFLVSQFDLFDQSALSI